MENYSGDLLLSPNTSATSNGYLIKLDHDFGCGYETSDTALLTVYPVALTPQNIILCDDSLFVEGAWQTSSGTYYDTLQSVQGCDSILQTNLTIGTSFFDGTGTVQICQGDSILIYGNYVSSAGDYYDSLLTINGCDSVYMTNVTVNPNYSMTNSYSLCPGDSIFAQGAWQQTTDIYYDSLLSVNGCDSVIISDVIMNAISVHSIDTGYCAGASVTVNGTTYSTPGAFDQYFTNSVGCDSILTVNVTEWSLPNADIGSDTLFVCDGQELVFGIDETGIASYSISNFSSTVFDDTLFFTYDMFNPVTSVVSQVTGGNGCTNSDQVTLIENEILNMSANFPTVNDPSVDFSIANMPGNVDFWYWSFGDGDTLSGNTNPTHVYTANGTYEACLIAENACGVDSSCFTITISTVGIEVLTSQALKIYPNPGNGVFNVINADGELSTELINSLGKVVKRITIPTGKSQFSLTGMPSGIYLLRFTSNSTVYQEPVYLINQ